MSADSLLVMNPVLSAQQSIPAPLPHVSQGLTNGLYRSAPSGLLCCCEVLLAHLYEPLPGTVVNATPFAPRLPLTNVSSVF